MLFHAWSHRLLLITTIFLLTCARPRLPNRHGYSSGGTEAGGYGITGVRHNIDRRGTQHCGRLFVLMVYPYVCCSTHISRYIEMLLVVPHYLFPLSEYPAFPSREPPPLSCFFPLGRGYLMREWNHAYYLAVLCPGCVSFGGPVVPFSLTSRWGFGPLVT